MIGFHDAAAIPAGVIGGTPGYAWPTSTRRYVQRRGGHGAYPQTTKPDRLASRIVAPCRLSSAAKTTPQSGGGPVGSSSGRKAQHHLGRGQASTDVRSYTPEVRSCCSRDPPDRPRRGDRRRNARRKMPVVTIREAEVTPSRSTPALSDRALARRRAVRRGACGKTPA